MVNQSNENQVYRYNSYLIVGFFGVLAGGALVGGLIYSIVVHGFSVGRLCIILLMLLGDGLLILKFIRTEIILEDDAIHFSGLWNEKRIPYDKIQRIETSAISWVPVEIFSDENPWWGLWGDITVQGHTLNWRDLVDELEDRVQTDV